MRVLELGPADLLGRRAPELGQLGFDVRRDATGIPWPSRNESVVASDIDCVSETFSGNKAHGLIHMSPFRASASEPHPWRSARRPPQAPSFRRRN